ncbi:MAG: tetratricopeptide repeat protein, partial [Candidatus Omnitrophica bacterium]|nr:tetratricopeptide repeat protein [Candidatus Omnitrophota bacterium]
MKNCYLLFYNKVVCKTVMKVISITIILFMVATTARAAKDDLIYSEAMKYIKEGKSEIAISKFQHIIQFYPTSKYADEAQFRMAEVFFNNKVYVNAANEFYKHSKLFPNSRFRNETRMYLQRLQSMELVKEGDVLYKEKNWKEALSKYSKALELYPGMPLLSDRIGRCKETYANDFIDSGNTYYNRKNWKAALNQYSKALELYPAAPLS